MTPLKSADLDSADDRFRIAARRSRLLLLDGKLSSRAIPGKDSFRLDWLSNVSSERGGGEEV